MHCSTNNNKTTCPKVTPKPEWVSLVARMTIQEMFSWTLTKTSRTSPNLHNFVTKTTTHNIVFVFFRSLSVASKSGYSLFSLSSVDSSLDKIYHCPSDEVFIIERLFESSLVAIVSLKAPRKLKVRWFCFCFLDDSRSSSVLLFDIWICFAMTKCIIFSSSSLCGVGRSI